MPIKYNFNKVEKDPEGKTLADPRLNIKQAKCCGSCKYFWYLFSRPRHGFCTLPRPEAEVPRQRLATFDEEALQAAGWLPTHTNLLCDKWEVVPKSKNVHKLMRNYTGLEFDVLGKLAPEEAQTTEIGRNAARSHDDL